jgi:MFS family permease
MAEEVYTVRASLDVDAARANAGLSQANRNLNQVGRNATSASSALNRMVGRVVAVGAAYVGVRTLAAGLGAVGRAALETNVALERMELRMGGVIFGMNEVNRTPISFDQARQQARGLVQELERVAVTSPATGSELASISAGLISFQRQAGMADDAIAGFAAQAASVGLIADIPLEQVASDLSRMAQGAAGAEQPFFKFLQAQGLITQSTQEFNRQNPAEIMEQLAGIMDRIGGPASEALATSWGGLTSTIRGLGEVFLRTFGGAAFDAVKNALKTSADLLVNNQDAIKALMERFGDRVGRAIVPLLEGVVNALTWALDNLDLIEAKMNAAFDTLAGAASVLSGLMPVIAKTAAMFLAFQAATSAAGTLQGVAAAGMARRRAGSAAGTAATVAGGAAGFGPMLAGLGTAISGGLSGIFAAISATLAPLMVPLAILAGLVIAVVAAFRLFGDTLGPMVTRTMEPFERVLDGLFSIFEGIYAVLEPILGLLGSVFLGLLLPLLQAFGLVLQIILAPFQLFFGLLRELATNVLKPFIQQLGGDLLPTFDELSTIVSEASRELSAWVDNMIAAFARFSRWIGSQIGASGPSGGQIIDAAESRNAELQERLRALTGGGAGGTPGGRRPGGGRGTTVNINNLNIKQEFRQADPDAVWVQIRDAVERESVQQIRSGFVSPLSR